MIVEVDFMYGCLFFIIICGVCYKMYEEGGEIGLDLIGLNCVNFVYILSNMIYLNEEI